MVATTINLKKDNLIKKGLVGFLGQLYFLVFLCPLLLEAMQDGR
ncbi:hypothetical protein AOH223_11830 [Helicobacter pylori]